jgi:hypothetical protein
MMNSRSVRVSGIYGSLVVWAAALIVLSSCAPPTDVVAPPQAPDSIAELIVNVPPADIALTRSDLPAGFQLAAEKSLGPEYVALYLRPSAVDPEASGGNVLLSVLTSVGVYATPAYAESIYLEVSADPAKQAFEDIPLAGGAATDILTQPFEGAVQGADASEAYRVTYRLMERPIFEYGHRFRMGNVLAYVVVAAVGDPDEPEHLLEDARDLVQRQIDHIAGAALQTVPD